MSDENAQRIEDSLRFANQMLGFDGVSDVPPPPGSRLGRLLALEEQLRGDGRSEPEIQQALAEFLRNS